MKISVHLGEPLKQSWISYAKKRGETASGLLAKIITQLLQAEKGKEPTFETESKKDWSDSTRVEMRFNAGELQALNDLVDHHGTTRQAFLIGLFRAYAAQEPQYSRSEVVALRKSNSQLRVIGANLNMIARALNQHELNHAQDIQPELEALKQAIDNHTAMVTQALNPPEMRYKLIEGRHHE